jgi:predicted RNA-binding protein with PIN domain
VLVVDGNNVMGSRPDGWWKDRAGAARRLVEQIAEWASEDVLVYFDGAPHPEMPSPGHVEVRYATRRGRDAADDDIAAFVASDRSPSDLCVVTSDAELSRRIRQAGAEVVGARWLLDRLD